MIVQRRNNNNKKNCTWKLTAVASLTLIIIIYL